MERNVPKLRFKGFNDEWKIDKLNENTYIKGRIGWKNLKQEEYTLKGPYLIAGKHINEGIINWDKCDHISEERYEESMEIALKDDDIIFSKDGSIGNPALIQNLKVKATINGTMMLIRLDQNEYEPSYFYQILKSEYFEKLIRNVKSGSSIPHIFQRDMIEFKFPVPGTLQEQKRIANFLTKVDKIIEKQDEKVKNLEKYKKGMMQKIFSQEIRFKDENGKEYPEWEEAKLSQYINAISSGKTKIKSDEGIYKVYGSTGVIGYSNNFDYFGEYVLIARVGANAGIINRINEKCGISDNTLVIECSDKMNYVFLEYMLRSYNLSKLIFGSGQPLVTGGQIKNIEMNLPILEEQIKIAGFLSSVDNIVKKEEEKLEKLKEWKKGLLQQMFV